MTVPVGRCTPPALTITNGIGRRTGMCDGAGAEAWSYDSMGRPLTEKRTTNIVTKSTSYTYNLDGSVATLTYPSGRTITYSYNAAARAISAVDTANSINYATAALYSPAGALASLTNGASLISTFYYNSRLQPCRISVKSSGTAPSSCADTANSGNVVDFSYGFNAGTANNGNVASIANNRNTARSQSFTYDELNRLKTAQTSSTTGQYCWGETFGYDIWANLLTIGAVTGYTGCTQENLSVAATTKNQISGDTYDSAGNLVTIPSVANYTYDAENRLLTAGGVTYTYDGDGKRVKKSNGKLYWYGMSSDANTETDSAGNNPVEYVFFGGKRIARRDSAVAVSYYFADHLGSSRVLTNSTGTVLDDSDFYPFGGERVVSASSGNPYKFTGKERDSESGLDNLGRRYYGSSLGRFGTPDPVMISSRRKVNPQIWNMYSYVGNNPLNFIDPLGEELVKLGQHTDEQIDERTKEINGQLKDKNLTKEQKEALKKEKNTLALEKQGNKTVGNMLAALDKTGQRNGLQLSDFTLSTDTRKDFAGHASADAMQKLLRADAFVLQDLQFGGTIYVRTEPEAGFYQMSQRIQDYEYYGASALSHEQMHLPWFGFGEYMAFSRQDVVFHGFKNYFQNSALYGSLDESIHKAIEDNSKPHP